MPYICESRASKDYLMDLILISFQFAIVTWEENGSRTRILCVLVAETTLTRNLVDGSTK